MQVLKGEAIMEMPKIVFCRLPPLVDGEYDPDMNLIWIDLLKPVNPVLTYLHEIAHFHHPDYSHARIQKYVAKVWRRTSQRQRFELYSSLFHRKFIYLNYYLGDEQPEIPGPGKRGKAKLTKAAQKKRKSSKE
jgi:hypothetical protein